jgi:hypothetical protein
MTHPTHDDAGHGRNAGPGMVLRIRAHKTEV